VNRVVIKDLEPNEVVDILVRLRDTIDLMGISRSVPTGTKLEHDLVLTVNLGEKILDIRENSFIESCSTCRVSEFTLHTFKYSRQGGDYLEAVVIELEDDIKAVQLQLAFS